MLPLKFKHVSAWAVFTLHFCSSPLSAEQHSLPHSGEYIYAAEDCWTTLSGQARCVRNVLDQTTSIVVYSGDEPGIVSYPLDVEPGSGESSYIQFYVNGVSETGSIFDIAGSMVRFQLESDQVVVDVFDPLTALWRQCGVAGQNKWLEVCVLKNESTWSLILNGALCMEEIACQTETATQPEITIYGDEASNLYVEQFCVSDSIFSVEVPTYVIDEK